MQLDVKTIEKIEVLAELLKRSPNKVIDEALDLYLKVEREKQLEDELSAHKKETDLTYDEFWDDLDFDE